MGIARNTEETLPIWYTTPISGMPGFRVPTGSYSTSL